MAHIMLYNVNMRTHGSSNLTLLFLGLTTLALATVTACAGPEGQTVETVDKQNRQAYEQLKTVTQLLIKRQYIKADGTINDENLVPEDMKKHLLVLVDFYHRVSVPRVLQLELDIPQIIKDTVIILFAFLNTNEPDSECYHSVSAFTAEDVIQRRKVYIFLPAHHVQSPTPPSQNVSINLCNSAFQDKRPKLENVNDYLSANSAGGSVFSYGCIENVAWVDKVKPCNTISEELNGLQFMHILLMHEGNEARNGSGPYRAFQIVGF